MKRKLGIALLVVATAMAGTPEAVNQFHDINQALRQWARTSLGGSFLVYAEGTNEQRTLPDRYDYHVVAPLATRNSEPGAAASYGLMASLSLPSAEHAHDGACPLQQRRRAAEPKVAVLRVPAASVAAQPALQIARGRRVITLTGREPLTRQIERAAAIAARALGTKLSAQQFAEIIKGQDAEAKLKTLRIKSTAETIKVRRTQPARIARFEDFELPAVNGFAPPAPLAPVELARRDNEDETRPAPGVEEPVKRNGNGKARSRTARPARPSEQREFDVAPFVIMAAADANAKGLDCDARNKDN